MSPTTRAQVAAVVQYLIACGGSAEASTVATDVCCIGAKALLKLVRAGKVDGVTVRDGQTLTLEQQGR